MESLNSNDLSDDDSFIDINHMDEVDNAISVTLPKKYRNMKYTFIIPFNYETNALRFRKTMKDSYTFTTMNQSDILKKLEAKTNIVKRVSFFFVFNNNTVKTLFYDLAKTYFVAYYAVYKDNYFIIGGD